MSNNTINKRKRVCIEPEIKLKIIKLKEDNPALSSELILYKIKQELGVDIGRTTLFDMCNNKSLIIKQCDNKEQLKRKKIDLYNSKGRNHMMEEALYIWIVQKLNNNAIITGNIIKAKAKVFGDKLGIKNFKYSEGWLSNFKKRFNISSFKICGESAGISNEDIVKGKEFIMKQMEGYTLDNVYNLDETALYYQVSPSRTMSNKPVKGTKKSKNRVTLILCSNYTGTDKLIPVVIGHYAKPKALRKFNHGDYVAYLSNKKAWCTSVIFQTYMEGVNDRMKKEKRNIVMFVDNASPHKVLTTYSNVKLVYLPINTTSHLQPMDAGIIHAFKCYYKSSLAENYVDSLDENYEFKADLSDAIILIHSSWRRVSKQTIFNCFDKSFNPRKLPNNHLTNIDDVEAVRYIKENNQELFIEDFEKTDALLTDDEIIDLTGYDSDINDPSQVIELEDSIEILSNNEANQCNSESVAITYSEAYNSHRKVVDYVNQIKEFGSIKEKSDITEIKQSFKKFEDFFRRMKERSSFTQTIDNYFKKQ